MGYYTEYKVKVLDAKTREDCTDKFRNEDEDSANFNRQKSKNHFKEEYCNRMTELFERYSKIQGIIDYMFCGESCKWYNHEVDMLSVSKVFPEYIFEVHGEGEETGDVWIKWFHDGKMQGGPAEIVLPNFDPNGFVEK